METNIQLQSCITSYKNYVSIEFNSSTYCELQSYQLATLKVTKTCLLNFFYLHAVVVAYINVELQSCICVVYKSM